MNNHAGKFFNSGQSLYLANKLNNNRLSHFRGELDTRQHTDVANYLDFPAHPDHPITSGPFVPDGEVHSSLSKSDLSYIKQINEIQADQVKTDNLLITIAGGLGAALGLSMFGIFGAVALGIGSFFATKSIASRRH